MLMDSLHQSYLITDAERICLKIKVSFVREDRDTFKIDGETSKGIKKALSKVYDLEERGEHK